MFVLAVGGVEVASGVPLLPLRSCGHYCGQTLVLGSLHSAGFVRVHRGCVGVAVRTGTWRVIAPGLSVWWGGRD